VCRVSISSHRKLREDSTFHEALQQGVETQESRMLLTDNTTHELAGSWTCVTCTLENADALSRCAACHARRPSEHVCRSQEPERRFVVVSAPPRKKHKSTEREDDRVEVAQATAEASASLPQATRSAHPLHVAEDGNFDSCSICGHGGLLVCCDMCPHAYHAACLGSSAPHEDGDEDSTWLCPPCKRVTTRQQRLTTDGKRCTGSGSALARAAAHSPDAQPLRPGVKVKAKYLASDPAMRRRYGPGRWYEGTIHAVNADGTYSVAYDDGDHEEGVQRKYIQLMTDASSAGKPRDPAAAEVGRRENAGRRENVTKAHPPTHQQTKIPPRRSCLAR
jgi:hypothetical protein